MLGFGQNQRSAQISRLGVRGSGEWGASIFARVGKILVLPIETFGSNAGMTDSQIWIR